MNARLNPEPIRTARFLDPRPTAEAAKNPIAESVNIPLDELSRRLSELRPKEIAMPVVGPDEVAVTAVELLRRLGRKAVQVTDFSYDPSWTGGRLWQPNEWLSTCLAALSAHGNVPGNALDLGSGAGRDAVYMAAAGWYVCAVDRLPDCIERGQKLADHYLPSDVAKALDWRVADVLGAEFLPYGQFDLITSLFLFDRELIRRTITWLAPAGHLIVEAFTTIRQQEVGKPSSPNRVVQPGEMQQLLGDFEIVRLHEGRHSRGHTVRVWARKPA